MPGAMDHEKRHDRRGLLSPDSFDEFEEHRDDFETTNDRLNGYECAYQGAVAYIERSTGWNVHNSVAARIPPISSTTYKKVLIGAGVALLLMLGFFSMPARHSNAPPNTALYANYRKPKDIKITGVVFYGRAKFVDILDCYLQRNLAVNGGLLDEVLFMQNTDKKDDLAYLDTLVEKVPQYKPVKLERDSFEFGGFDLAWATMTENNTIYLKIDDDVVYMHDDAVPRMVDTLIKHPEAHNIAGNIINSPITNWFHYHNDAVYPFLPEESAPENGSVPIGEQVDWRVNNLPAHSGDVPDEYDYSHQDDRPWGGFSVGDKGGPSYENQRFLMLTNDSEHTSSAQLMRTPIAKAAYDAFGMELFSWAMAGQQHYSLLKNIEDGTTSKYWFGNQDGVWNMQYERYNLNFLAIWGSTVAMQLPGGDDEGDFTGKIPREFHRPCLVDTHALVAHFNFGPQPELIHTDLLDKYRSYANEMVCAANNQKSRLPPSKLESDLLVDTGMPPAINDFVPDDSTD